MVGNLVLVDGQAASIPGTAAVGADIVEVRRDGLFVEQGTWTMFGK